MSPDAARKFLIKSTCELENTPKRMNNKVQYKVNMRIRKYIKANEQQSST